jgi:hypothetical protein
MRELILGQSYVAVRPTLKQWSPSACLSVTGVHPGEMAEGIDLICGVWASPATLFPGIRWGRSGPHKPLGMFSMGRHSRLKLENGWADFVKTLHIY